MQSIDQCFFSVVNSDAGSSTITPLKNYARPIIRSSDYKTIIEKRVFQGAKSDKRMRRFFVARLIIIVGAGFP